MLDLQLWVTTQPDSLKDSQYSHCMKSVRTVFGLILVSILPHLDWIRSRLTPNTDTLHIVIAKKRMGWIFHYIFFPFLFFALDFTLDDHGLFVFYANQRSAHIHFLWDLLFGFFLDISCASFTLITSRKTLSPRIVYLEVSFTLYCRFVM